MATKKTSSKMPMRVFLEVVEIKDGLLVWREGWREKHGLSRSKRYPPGGMVQPLYHPVSGRAYVSINAGTVRYQISYPRAIIAASTGRWPKNRCWLIDGDPTNLTTDNVSSKFVPWWEREGVDWPKPRKQCKQEE